MTPSISTYQPVLVPLPWQPVPVPVRDLFVGLKLDPAAENSTSCGARILRATPPRVAAPSFAPPAWQEVADLAGKVEGTIARLVVSEDQHRLASVVQVDAPS